MKRINIELRDDEWKEISDTLRHEFGEPLSDKEIENIVMNDVLKFIHDIYIHGFGV